MGRDRQHRTERARVHLRPADSRQERDDSRPDRRAASRLQPRRASADHRIVGRADGRSVLAVCRRARARGRRGAQSRARRQRDHHEPAHRRDSRDGERADVQPERLPRVRRRRAPQPCDSGSLRAGLDLQGRDCVGGDRREGDGRRRSHRHQSRPAARRLGAGHHRRQPSQQRPADVHQGHRQVEQHRRGQDRVPRRHRASQPIRLALRIRPSGLAGLSGRESRHRLEARKVDRQRARVGVDGLSGRGDAAADGGGGQLGGQRRRVRRAARHSRRLSQRRALSGASERSAARDQSGHCRGADDDHGRGRHRGDGKARADRRLHGCREDRDGAEADQRTLLALGSLRVVCRLPAVAQSRDCDGRCHRLREGTER